MSLLLPIKALPKGEFSEFDFLPPSNFFSLEHYAEDELSSQDKINLWNDQIGVAPASIYQILTQDLPGQPHLLFEVDEGTLGLIVSEEDGLYDDNRLLDFSEKLTHVGDMNVSIPLHGQGVGRTLLRNHIELGVHLGLEYFDINASASTNASWTWARAHVPVSEEGLNPFYTKMRIRHDSFGQFMRKPILDAASRILAAPSTSMPSDLAYLDHDITDFVRQTVEAGGNSEFFMAYYNKLLDSKRNCSDSEEKIKSLCSTLKSTFFCLVREHLDYCEKKGRNFTIGALYLLGAGYSGRIDYADEQTTAQISRYVGGFKSIYFAPKPAHAVPRLWPSQSPLP